MLREICVTQTESTLVPTSQILKAGDRQIFVLKKREKAGDPEKVVEVTLKVEDNLVKLLKK